MKKVFHILFCGLAASLFGGVAQGSFADCRCAIREIVRVHSPAEFSCRVERFAGVKNLKLRISVRGVEFEGEPQEIRKKEEKLRQLLAKTKILELTNVEDRKYFRLLADVKADGVDIKTYLEGNPAKATQEKALPKETVTTPARPAPHLPALRPVAAASPPEKPSRHLTSQDVETLLLQTGDLSALTPRTPLGEAIEILSGSVSPQIPIVILWNDLRENAFVDPHTPIGVGGLSHLPTGQALDLILRSIGVAAVERPIALVEGSVVTIGTARTLKPRLRNQVYSVQELTLPPLWISEMAGNLTPTGGTVSR